jgi:coenzyme Q-binding protein COQ10
MPSIIKQQRVSIAPKNAFASVKDFKSYPEFLPWCSGARLQSSVMLNDTTEVFIADLIIKYKIFTENFTTRVTCHSDTYHIDIEYIKGPFKNLHSYWRFHAVPDSETQTDIEFMIDFTMKFSPLQKVMEIFFEEAMKKMISAFDARFKSLTFIP